MGLLSLVQLHTSNCRLLHCLTCKGPSAALAVKRHCLRSPSAENRRRPPQQQTNAILSYRAARKSTSVASYSYIVRILYIAIYIRSASRRARARGRGRGHCGPARARAARGPQCAAAPTSSRCSRWRDARWPRTVLLSARSGWRQSTTCRAPCVPAEHDRLCRFRLAANARRRPATPRRWP